MWHDHHHRRHGTVTAALAEDRPHRPEFADLYRTVVRYARPPGSRAEERPADAAKILRWLESASVPVLALEDEVERALSAIALRLDDKAAAATVTRRKRPPLN